jgi:hypothetical protein
MVLTVTLPVIDAVWAWGSPADLAHAGTAKLSRAKSSFPHNLNDTNLAEWLCFFTATHLWEIVIQTSERRDRSGAFDEID